MKHRFTLVELLVVITIIAILAGMLLPALNGARARSKSAKCLSNLKQTALALFQYSGDYNEYVMVRPTASSWAQIMSEGWSTYTASSAKPLNYISLDVIHCPLREKPAADYFGMYGILAARRDSPYDYRKKFGGVAFCKSDGPWLALAMRQLRNSTEFPLVADTVATANANKGKSAYWFSPVDDLGGSKPMISLCHSGFSNMAMADGHCISRNRTQLESGIMEFSAVADENGNLL